MSTTKYLMYPLTLMLLLVPLPVWAEEMPVETIQAEEPAPESPFSEEGGNLDDEIQDVVLEEPGQAESSDPVQETVLDPDTESQPGISDQETIQESENGTEIESEIETESEMESETESEIETESEMESETKQSALDDETVDLLKRYLTQSVSGNDTEPESAPEETIFSDMESLLLKVDRIIDLLSEQKLVMLVAGVLTVIGLGLLAGFQILRRLH